MVVALTTVTPVATAPPMVTAVAAVRLVPVMVTEVPPVAGPLGGEMSVTVGAAGRVVNETSMPYEVPTVLVAYALT